MNEQDIIWNGTRNPSKALKLLPMWEINNICRKNDVFVLRVHNGWFWKCNDVAWVCPITSSNFPTVVVWQRGALCPAVTGGQGVKVGGCGHRGLGFIWLWVSVLHTLFPVFKLWAAELSMVACNFIILVPPESAHGWPKWLLMSVEMIKQHVAIYTQFQIPSKDGVRIVSQFKWDNAIVTGPYYFMQAFLHTETLFLNDWCWVTSPRTHNRNSLALHPEIELPSLTGRQVCPFF